MKFVAKLVLATTGAVEQVVLNADDAAHARLQLQLRPHSQDEVVVSLRKSSVLALWSSQRKFDVSLFCIELSRLLRAGLTLPEAFETLALRVSGTAREVLSALMTRLQEGKRLSDAMSTVGLFPSVLTAAVRASERSGRVADALEEFARFDSALRELKRKVVNAAIYPGLVVAFGLLVALFLIGFVVPRFAEIFAGTNASLSGGTTVLLRLGLLISNHPVAVLAAVVLTGLLLVAVVAREEFRRWALSYLQRLSMVASFLKRLQLAQVTRAMAMLLRNGFAVPEAMALARVLASSPDLSEAMILANTRIDAGSTVSAAWASTSLADDYATRILQAGERTGDLSRSFETLAETYQRDVEVALERTTRIVEPVLLMAVATVIGVVVVLMYAPIFDLAGSLS
jgi:general secretion pathway protein F